MINFQPKCEEYLNEVNNNKLLIKYHKLIEVFPSVLLIVGGALMALLLFLLTDLKNTWLCLILSLIGIVYLITITHVLRAKFKKNNEIIIKKFTEYYAPTNQRDYARIKSDNGDILIRTKSLVLGGNPLMVFIEGENLCFITAQVFGLKNLVLSGKQKPLAYTISHIPVYDSLDIFTLESRFDHIISEDFGKMILPTKDIDNYHDKQLVVAQGDKVLYIDFEDCRFMDNLLPTKNFYFNVKKKD